MAALTSSDFTTSAASGSTVSFSGTQLSITRPSSQYASSYAVTNSTKNSQIIICQADLSWTDNGNNEDMVGIMLTSSSQSSTNDYSLTYSAKIQSRSNTAGSYRLTAGTTTWNSYDNEPGIQDGKTVKITYDTSNNNIKFWYWGGSSWTQMGTTQTYNILNSSTIKFAAQYTNIYSTVSPMIADNMYFDSYSSDYSTQYPATSSVNSGFFLFL